MRRFPNSPSGKLLCHHEIDMQAVGNDKPEGSYAGMTKTFGNPRIEAQTFTSE